MMMVLLLGREEEAIILSSTLDCGCVVCCESFSSCAVEADDGFCFCNESCRTSLNAVCCNNQTLCDSQTIDPLLFAP